MGTPAHWSDKWMRIPYETGTADCAVLCERVLSQEFGKIVALPTARGETWREFSAVIDAHKDTHLAPTDAPREGDCVLMIGRGRVNHLGIYCEICAEQYVLHAMETAGESVRHRLRDLPRLGIAIEGFYRWK